MLVLVENGEAVDILHRHDCVLEAALFPGLACALLALHRIGIDVVPGEAVLGRDQVGRDALRHEIGVDGDGRIDRDAEARGAHADAGHALDAAADRHLLLAGHHLRRGKVHRIEARGAEAVDLDARHRGAEAGIHGGEARNVTAGLAHRIDHAEHHVVDAVGSEIVALLQRPQRHGGQRQRGDFVQRAVGLALAARGADVIVDICFRHDALP